MQKRIIAQKFIYASIPLVAVIAMVAAIYLYEDIRGRTEWKKVSNHLKSEGLSLDIQSFKVPQPEDSQNFAATPLINSLVDYEFDPQDEKNVYKNSEIRKRFKSMAVQGDAETKGNLGSWIRQSLTNSEEISKIFKKPKGELLSVFDPFREEILELEIAATRRYAQMPTENVDQKFSGALIGPTPWAEDFRNHGEFQRCRGLVALAEGEPDIAMSALRILEKIAKNGRFPSVYTWESYRKNFDWLFIWDCLGRD